MDKFRLFKDGVSDAHKDHVVPAVHGIAKLLRKHPDQDEVETIGRGILAANNPRRSKFTKIALGVAAAAVLAGLMYWNKDKLASSIGKAIERGGPALKNAVYGTASAVKSGVSKVGRHGMFIINSMLGSMPIDVQPEIPPDNNIRPPPTDNIPPETRRKEAVKRKANNRRNSAPTGYNDQQPTRRRPTAAELAAARAPGMPQSYGNPERWRY
jgi:hypothetical protein